MSDKVYQVIKNSHLFSELPPRLVDEIVASAITKTLAANELLFQKGDPADALWGVLSGCIAITMRAEDGKEIVLNEYHAGDVFGEVGTLDFGPRRVEASASCDTEVFRLERSFFLGLLQISPELCYRVFSLLCEHLRASTETLEDMVLYKLPSRLAKRLVLMSQTSVTNEAGTMLNISQSDLARLMGVNREAINRQLKEWENAGWISCQRQKIELLSKKSLSKLSAPGLGNGHDSWSNGRGPWGEFETVTSTSAFQSTNRPLNKHFAAVLAINCADYSKLLMTDSKATVRQVKTTLASMHKSITDHGGNAVWGVGERALAEFPDVSSAMNAALSIQQSAGGSETGPEQSKSFLRIGINSGEVQSGAGQFSGEPVNIAIRLTELAGPGGICCTDEVRDVLEASGEFKLQFLGKFELKNVARPINAYSAYSIPWIKRIKLKAESLIPRRLQSTIATYSMLLLTLAALWLTTVVLDQDTEIHRPANSIAVLPFIFEGDGDHAWLADGLAESIRTSLASRTELLVIGKQSSEYFKGKTVSFEEIRETLPAAFILSGSTGRTGDQLSISARLIDTHNGNVIWDQDYKGSWLKLNSYQTDIVQIVGEKLNQGTPSNKAVTEDLPMTNHPEAYALYLMAHSLVKKSNSNAYMEAHLLLRQAVELDPEFAMAWLMLSTLYDNDFLDAQPGGSAETRLKLQDEAWSHALELAPDSASVLSNRAFREFRSGDMETAKQLLNRALAVNPNLASTLSALWSISLAENNWIAMLQITDRLLQLDPLHFYFMSRHTRTRMELGMCEEVMSMAKRALSLYPDNMVAYSWMGECLNQKGDRLGAIEASRKARPYSIPFDLWFDLDGFNWSFSGMRPHYAVPAYTYTGNIDKARHFLDLAYPSGINSPTSYQAWEYLVARGELEVLAGDYEQGIWCFEQALIQHPVSMEELVFSATLFQWASPYRQSVSAMALLYAYRKTANVEKAMDIAKIIREGLNHRRRALGLAGARNPESKYLYVEAQLHAIEGRPKEALDTLERWLKNDLALFNYIKTDPFLESLHNELRFWSIVDSVEIKLTEILSNYLAKRSKPEVST